MDSPQWWLRIEFTDEVKRLPRGHLRVLIYSLVCLIAFADHTLGYQFGFSMFYLLPVILATRNLGRATGFFISVLSASLWAGMDYVHSTQLPGAVLPNWTMFFRLILFGIVVLIVDGWDKERMYARTDILTGLPNRGAFHEFGNAEVRRARRSGRPFSLIYIDVDNFKLINDRYGHRAGDNLLTMLAAAFRSNFRDTDYIARLGGDEFGIFLVDTHVEGAMTALNRISQELEKIPRMGSVVTISVGLLTVISSPYLFEEVVKRADELMYLAKSRGKNRIESDILNAPPQARPTPPEPGA